MAPGRDERDLTPIVVAIPARDEEENIAACLMALGSQTVRPSTVVLLLNNCTDETERVAMRLALPFSLDIQTVMLPSIDANAGTARRLVMGRAAELAGRNGVLMTTDADAIVPPNWIALNMSALAAGADVVCGQAVIDPREAAAIPSHLHEDDALECQYADLLDAIGDAVCPDPVDPRPRHTEASGASLAIKARTFLQAGGVPHVRTGEDRALVDALRRIDAPIRHDPAICVTVSGRIVGRAAGGMADTIRRRMVQQDEFIDERLEPAGDALRRADFRQRARVAWKSHVHDPDLAADLQLPPAILETYLGAKFFGTAWDRIERQSPMLPRRRVRFVELPQYIEYARELLVQLEVGVSG